MLPKSRLDSTPNIQPEATRSLILLIAFLPMHVTALNLIDTDLCHVTLRCILFKIRPL